MSFFGDGGGGGYRPRGRGHRYPSAPNLGFGILPLMRPPNHHMQHRNSMGLQQRGGGRPPFRGGRYKTPGRGEVVRMGPSKPVPSPVKKEENKKTPVKEVKKEDKSEPSTSSTPQKKEETKPAEVKVKEESKVESKAIVKKEIENVKPTRIELDRYNSELHLELSDHNLAGRIMRGDGFQYMWGGVRGTHGVSKGKVCFEVHLLENDKVDLPEEKIPCVARIGWSVDGSDYQLGEDKLSWGYGGTGKSSTNSKFRDYGKTFGVGDVVTCYVDLDTVPKAIFYMLNGEYLGVAFRFTNELGDKAIYPHITLKNMKFRVNFGATQPKFSLTNGFSMMQSLLVKDLVMPPPGPKPENAEIIMMIGLPGCGKSHWCEKYSQDHPDKKYYILGTNIIIDRMKVSNLLRKRNYHDRWEELIKRASGVLNKLFEIAKNTPRNYILDQTNVYFTARRRKIEAFRGYKRIAATIVNKPDVLKWRTDKQKQAEGKIIPEEAVMEMKRNFTLPEVGPSFDEVWYLEEKLPTARDIVQVYRSIGEEFKTKAPKRPSDQDRKPSEDKRPKLESAPNRGVHSVVLGSTGQDRHVGGHNREGDSRPPYRADDNRRDSRNTRKEEYPNRDNRPATRNDQHDNRFNRNNNNRDDRSNNRDGRDKNTRDVHDNNGVGPRDDRDRGFTRREEDRKPLIQQKEPFDNRNPQRQTRPDTQRVGRPDAQRADRLDARSDNGRPERSFNTPQRDNRNTPRERYPEENTQQDNRRALPPRGDDKPFESRPQQRHDIPPPGDRDNRPYQEEARHPPSDSRYPVTQYNSRGPVQSDYGDVPPFHMDQRFRDKAPPARQEEGQQRRQLEPRYNQDRDLSTRDRPYEKLLDPTAAPFRSERDQHLSKIDLQKPTDPYARELPKDSYQDSYHRKPYNRDSYNEQPAYSDSADYKRTVDPPREQHYGRSEERYADTPKQKPLDNRRYEEPPPKVAREELLRRDDEQGAAYFDRPNTSRVAGDAPIPARYDAQRDQYNQGQQSSTSRGYGTSYDDQSYQSHPRDSADQERYPEQSRRDNFERPDRAPVDQRYERDQRPPAAVYGERDGYQREHQSYPNAKDEWGRNPESRERREDGGRSQQDLAYGRERDSYSQESYRDADKSYNSQYNRNPPPEARDDHTDDSGQYRTPDKGGRGYDQESSRSFSGSVKQGSGNDSFAYSSNAHHSNDRVSSSYQTQMTTSTANYGHQVPSITSHTYNRDTDKPPLRQSEHNPSLSRDQSRYPAAPSAPQQPAPGDRSGSKSYEKQQEDYKKAYSQWYANYAQAYAQLKDPK